MPAGGQRLLFSATLDGEVDTLVKRYLTDPVTPRGRRRPAASVTTMAHHVLAREAGGQGPVTAAIAAREGRTVIFVRTKLGADRVAEQLREPGVRAGALHGGLDPGRPHPHAGRLQGRARPGAGRHRRRGPRHPRRRRSAWSCRSTRRPTTRTTCTAPAVPRAPARPAPSSPWPCRTSGGTVERLTTAAGVEATPEQVAPHDDAAPAGHPGAVPSGVVGRRARPVPAAAPDRRDRPPQRRLRRTARGRPASRRGPRRRAARREGGYAGRREGAVPRGPRQPR